MAARPRPAPEPELLRPPQQTRSRESLERVLAAGHALLEEQGWEGFTVQEVSRRAKVSIGSIYARAPSKEALLLAVYDRAVAHINADQEARLDDEARWDELDTRELIVQAARDVTENMLRHERILKVFMNRSPVDETIRTRADEQIKRLAARWEELVLRRAREITHPEPQLAI